MFGFADNITDLGSTRIHMGKTNTYADNQHQGSISIKRHFLSGSSGLGYVMRPILLII